MSRAWQEHFDPCFVKHVDWLASLRRSSLRSVCALWLAASPQHRHTPHPPPPPSQCLGVHSVSASAMLPGVRTKATCVRKTYLPASSVEESALNRNIAAILLSFQSFFIILLAPPIQERPDKSPAQWAARWSGSSGGLDGAGLCGVWESGGFVLSSVACAADTLSCLLSALRGTW